MRAMAVMTVLAVSGFALPAMAFEGEIEAKAVGTNQGTGTMRVLVSKRGDVRLETTAKQRGKSQSVTMIKPAKGKFNYTVNHDKKIVVKMPKDMIDQMAGKMNKDAKDQFDKKRLQVKKLGKEKVAGQTARHVRIIDNEEGTVSDMWLSDKYPADLWAKMFTFGSATNNQMRGWEKAAKKFGVKPGFVLKMMHKDKGGERGGLEITKIKERKVAKTDFAPPAGYKVVDTPTIPGGLQNMKMPTTREGAEKMRKELMEKMKNMQR